MRRITIGYQCKGQALAETMIAGAVLGSVLLASVTLYQIMQADITANKAARLATWHGVLYQGLTTDEMEDKYAENIEETLMHRSVRDVMDNNAENLVGDAQNIRYAYSDVSPTFSYPSNRSTFIANRAGLNNNTVSGVSLSIPLNNDAEIFKLVDARSYAVSDTVDQPIPYDAIADEYRFHVKAKAALLSNGFVPMNEEGFTDAISRISADGNPMTYFQIWRAPLDFFGFDEIDPAMGEAGLSTVAQDQSRVLPPELGTFIE